MGPGRDEERHEAVRGRIHAEVWRKGELPGEVYMSHNLFECGTCCRHILRLLFWDALVRCEASEVFSEAISRTAVPV